MVTRLRILGAAIVSALLTVMAALAMLSGAQLATYLGSGLLCLALPLTALAGALVGFGMAAAMLWSMGRPFPAVRADSAGISIGGGLVTPWREIGGVAYRRSATGFSHIEISLRNGEVLRPKIPLTVGLEDIGAFFAVVERRLPTSEPVRLAQAVQQP